METKSQFRVWPVCGDESQAVSVEVIDAFEAAENAFLNFVDIHAGFDAIALNCEGAGGLSVVTITSAVQQPFAPVEAA